MVNPNVPDYSLSAHPENFIKICPCLPEIISALTLRIGKQKYNAIDDII